MNKRNYQRELEQLIETHERAGEIPRLLIHACCAPCSSYVMEYLSRYFRIDFYYYNPNIDTREEYEHRIGELTRLAEELRTVHPVHVVSEAYEPERFYAAVKGHENDPERGERCHICYELRLRKTAEFMLRENERLCGGKKQGGGAEQGAYEKAQAENASLPHKQRAALFAEEAETSEKKDAGNDVPYAYFTTTLSISPMKDAAVLNGIGERIASEYGLLYLPSDFKKKGGYQRSTELSREYGLYRQDYCGCIFSKRERFLIDIPGSRGYNER